MVVQLVVLEADVLTALDVSTIRPELALGAGSHSVGGQETQRVCSRISLLGGCKGLRLCSAWAMRRAMGAKEAMYRACQWMCLGHLVAPSVGPLMEVVTRMREIRQRVKQILQDFSVALQLQLWRPSVWMEAH